MYAAETARPRLQSRGRAFTGVQAGCNQC